MPPWPHGPFHFLYDGSLDSVNQHQSMQSLIMDIKGAIIRLFKKS